MYLEKTLIFSVSSRKLYFWIWNLPIFRFWRWAIQDTLLSLVVTPPSQGATPLNQEHILPKPAATPLHKVGTPLHKAAILQQQGATPNRLVVTHPRRAVSLLQREVTPQQQGATLPRLVVTLPQLEVSHLNQDTNSSLEQGVIPPCPQQVWIGFSKLTISTQNVDVRINIWTRTHSIFDRWQYFHCRWRLGRRTRWLRCSKCVFLKVSVITAEGWALTTVLSLQPGGAQQGYPGGPAPGQPTPSYPGAPSTNPSMPGYGGGAPSHPQTPAISVRCICSNSLKNHLKKRLKMGKYQLRLLYPFNRKVTGAPLKTLQGLTLSGMLKFSVKPWKDLVST